MIQATSRASPIMSDTSTILLFAKQPIPGQVKSRISTTLGQDAALSLYGYFLLDTLVQAEHTGIIVRICVFPPDGIPAMTAWLGSNRNYLPQKGSDLGQRMEQAFRAIFAEGIERAILIGSDLPDLSTDLLREAMDALLRHDAVIGPARDGGYYLVGFRKKGFLPDIFRGMAWSTPGVYEQTMQVFRSRGTSVHVLPPWQDVDTLQDLRDLMERNNGTAFAHSRTMRYLGTIKDRIHAAEGAHGKI